MKPEKAVKHVLMISVENLRPDLDCFGKTKLHTPHIDALAQKAVCYERAYSQYRQCMLSRARLRCRHDISFC